jgi:Ca2+-binding EF-hand superfamily protein
MTEAADIDWETINAKLPYERTAELKEKRRELFKQFDPNSNGYLSLAEVLSHPPLNRKYNKNEMCLTKTIVVVLFSLWFLS